MIAAVSASGEAAIARATATPISLNTKMMRLELNDTLEGDPFRHEVLRSGRPRRKVKEAQD